MKLNKKTLMSILGAFGLSAGGTISGAYLIGPSEGLVQQTYLDPVGIATVCFGHTGKDVAIGQTYTKKECTAKMVEDIKQARKEVYEYIHVPLTFYQEAALISFTYNVGPKNLSSSTLVKKFNHKDYSGGCKELLRWVYAGGKKLKGLEMRRHKEYMVCMGDFSEL